MALTYDQQTYYRRTVQDLGVPEGASNFKSDTFTGNGATTAFTLSHAPDLTDYTPVILLNNGMQDTAQASISGTTLTFVTAPIGGSIVRCSYQY